MKHRAPAFLAASAAALALLSTAAAQPARSPGDALNATGDFAAAGRAYETALKASPSDANALAGLARVRLYENRLEEAVALAQRVLAAQPANPPARQVLGVAQQRQAAFEQAAAKGGANIVPFWLVSDHFMMARAHLQHGSEGTFLIDTGMAGGGIGAPKAVLDEAGVVIDPAKAQTGMGGAGPVTFIPIRAGATLGSLTVDDVPGVYTPGGEIAGAFPFRLSGQLSHMFFRHSRLTFDFEAMTLVTQAC